MCKGHWLEIRHGVKICYAQWEDVGPFWTDSSGYVFGQRPAVGSQSILGAVPDAPRELRISMELDVCPLPFTDSAAAIIDGNIGELTRFHETFRIYAHAVGPETATLPEGFEHRLVEMNIGGVRVHCLAPIDLAYSKLAAGREKDTEFVVGLLHHKIARPSQLRRLIGGANIEIRPTSESSRFRRLLLLL